MDGWDGLSYTAVTPRASLQSDANNNTSFASGRQLGLDILWALVPEFKSNVVVPLHTLLNTLRIL